MTQFFSFFFIKATVKSLFWALSWHKYIIDILNLPFIFLMVTATFKHKCYKLMISMSQNMFKYFGGMIPGTKTQNLKFLVKNTPLRASLVAQWLRICLLMQGTRVRALVWEDPTCHGAAGPVSHSCWACASGACAPQREGPRW